MHCTRLLKTTALALCLAGSFSVASHASSHREAPAITAMPKVDGTDFYMFQSYEAGHNGFTTLIANYMPGQSPFDGPNYYAFDPSAIYEIHIDNVGDAKEHLTFQFKFQQSIPNGTGVALSVGGQSVAVPLKNVGAISAGNNANLNFNESYTINLIQGDRRTGTKSAITNASGGGATFTKPIDYIGDKTFSNAGAYENYAKQYVYNVVIPGCNIAGRVFVGQRKESFSVNLGQVFDLVNFNPLTIANDPNNNALRHKNISSIALEVPTACLTAGGNGVIGGWSTASLPQAKLLNPQANFATPTVAGGAYTQVSRLGMPLVNELVIGLKDKDRFNASKPSGDAQFLTYVTNPSLPALLEVLFPGVAKAPTNFPRNDLIAAFLTGFQGVSQLATVTPSEMLRLNTGVAPTPYGSQQTLGVVAGDAAGFPNGRRPGDDIVDVTLRVAEGRLCYPVTNATIGLNNANLGLCAPADAPSGNQPFSDGAPVDTDFQAIFPYLKTPLSGSDISNY